MEPGVDDDVVALASAWCDVERSRSSTSPDIRTVLVAVT